MVSSLRRLVMLGLLLLVGVSSAGCSCGGSDGGGDGGTPPDTTDGGTMPDGGVEPLDETVYPDGPFPSGGGFLPPPRPPVRTGTLALTRSRINSAWNLLPSLPAARIALLDTGVDTAHPNLAGRVGPGYDYVRDLADVVDTEGHGTAMAGALAGSGTGPSGGSFVGACSTCIVLPYRVLSASGEVSAADFNARAARAVQAAVREGAHVIVFGVSSPVATPELADAIQQALAQGIPVVAPAGNDGTTELEFPASLPGVISVGATYNASDLLHAHSNNAPGLTVLAPGESMVSLAPAGGFEVFGHTSLATAMVGGTAALLRGTRPSLRAEAVTSLIRGWAVPLDPAPSSEALGFGRLDARAAIETVTGPIGSITTLTDLAIGYAELIPARPKAGDKAWAVVRVENRGITDVDLTGRAVRLWVNNQYVNKQPLKGVLRPSERLEVRVFWPVSQAPGRVPVAVELAHSEQSSPADNVPGDDLRAIQEATLVAGPAPDLNAPLENLRAVARTETMLDPEIVADDRSDLRIIAITSPDDRRVGKTGRTFHVHLANHGTRPEEGRRLAWSLPGQDFPEVPVPTLLPGQRAIVELAWRDFTGGDLPFSLTLRVNIVPPEGGTVGPLQRHAFRFRYLPSGGVARTEYVDVPGPDMVVDAPFRIDTTRDEIPVLFFAPDYGDDEVTFSRMNLALSSTPDFSRSPPQVQSIYSQRGERGSSSWQPATVVDAWGRTQQNGFSTQLFPTEPLDHHTQGGWHAILRVPWSHLEAKMPSAQDPDGPAYYLQGTIYVKRTAILWRLVPFADEDELAFRRVLKVVRNRLPRLPGRDRDHYFDAHFHTINEYIQTPGITAGFNYVLLPMKAFGGPLGMAVESAYAQGFISLAERDGWTSGSAANRITFTDHNVFLSTNTAVSQSPDDCPGFGPTRPESGPCDEFATMRRLFDKGAGEEIAVAGGAHLLPIPFSQVKGGAHLLSYGDTHRDGPWHGGSPSQPNPLEVGALLEQIARGPSTDDPFSFAAHPFAKPLAWSGAALTRALGYGVAPATHPNVGLTFKGFQVWNQKKEFCRSFRDADLFTSLNPFPDARSNTEWAKSSTYRAWIRDDVREWESRIRRGLRYADPGGTGTFFRKVFAMGGTDAHGDFNYSTDITSTLVASRLIHSLLPDDEHSVCSNAWGMVRTMAVVEDCSVPEDCPRGLTCAAGACVGGREKQDAPALSAMGHGRAVVTDGPVAHLVLDAQTQFSSRTLEWDENKQSFTAGTADPWFDVDGYMGGAGRFDGAGTALMPVDGPVMDDTWTSYWNSTPNFVRTVVSWGGNASQALEGTYLTYVFPAETNQNVRELRPYSTWDDTIPLPVPPENSPAYLRYAAGNSVPATQQPRSSSEEPFALYYHGLSVARSGYQTPAFEFLTNPIWVAPVPLLVRNNAECVNQSARLTRVAVRLRIPLTLNETQPFAEVYLQALDPATGRSGGPKYPLVPSAGYPRDTGAGADLVQRGEHEYEATLDVQLLGSPGASSGSYIIVFRDPKDPHDNVLNSFAVRRRLPQCVDTPSSKPLCCEFNPTGLTRNCYSASPNGACGSCGVTCRATERCEAGQCVDNLGPWTCSGVTCTPPQTCCYGRCMSFVNNDQACGACGNPCKADERCCGTTCVPLGTESNCLDCGDTCTAGQTCCKFGGCQDLSSTPTACGGCLRQCDTTFEPLCRLGECKARDDVSSCGSAGIACGARQGCCPIFANHNPFTIADYACRPLDTASDCGKCNEQCRADRCDLEPTGKRCGNECDDGTTCSEGVCQ